EVEDRRTWSHDERLPGPGRQEALEEAQAPADRLQLVLGGLHLDPSLGDLLVGLMNLGGELVHLFLEEKELGLFGVDPLPRLAELVMSLLEPRVGERARFLRTSPAA